MSGAIDPGCVQLRLAVEAGRVAVVDVASERPRVAEVLRGREADSAVKLVPLLFALCGKAQGRAAELALAAARGRECAAHLDPAIQAEAMREHLWRWLLDLPPLLGEAADQAEFARLARDIASGQRDAVADFLDGERIATLRRRLGEMEDAVPSQGCLLPWLDATSSLRPWPQLDAGFCARPQWQGRAAETGAIARRPARRLPDLPSPHAGWRAWKNCATGRQVSKKSAPAARRARRKRRPDAAVRWSKRRAGC
jgi:hypothetical protein